MDSRFSVMVVLAILVSEKIITEEKAKQLINTIDLRLKGINITKLSTEETINLLTKGEL